MKNLSENSQFDSKPYLLTINLSKIMTFTVIVFALFGCMEDSEDAPTLTEPCIENCSEVSQDISSPTNSSIPLSSVGQPGLSSNSIDPVISSVPSQGTSSEVIPISSEVPDWKHIAFYIVAHADDWQIFMGDHAYRDLLSADSVIFIYLTAGEAGRDEIFWGAREAGALNSIAWTHQIPLNTQDEIITVDGNEIMKNKIANSTSYWMRMPDGNGSGDGFFEYGNQSMIKLDRGTIQSIGTVNEGGTYTKDKIVSTLVTLIGYHTQPGWSQSFHLQDDNESLNPGNHPDHIMASRYAQQALGQLGQYDITVFLDYANSSKSQNLPQDTVDIKNGLFDAYDEKMIDIANYNTIATEGNIYRTWLARTHYRPINGSYSE